MGSDALALPMLNALMAHEAVRLVGVFTQPDRRVGRGMKLQANAIKQWAQGLHIPVLQPEKIAAPEYAWLRKSRCELILVMAYGHILADALLRIPRLGVFNVHTSLLPAYRGASPIQTAIACGECETGVTLMGIVRAMDAGPIADQERFAIGSEDDSPAVYRKAATACVPLLERNVPALLAGGLKLVSQDNAQASYCRRLRKDDGVLDFTAPASRLYNRIRAFRPWPGCFLDYAGQRLKLGAASISDAPADAPPGQIIGLRDAGLAVATSRGVLILHELQRPGGRMLGIREFLAGFNLPLGTQLTSLSMPDLLVKGR